MTALPGEGLDTMLNPAAPKSEMPSNASTPGAGPALNAVFSCFLRSSGVVVFQSLPERENHRHQHREGSPLVPNNSSTAAQEAGAVTTPGAASCCGMDPE